MAVGGAARSRPSSGIDFRSPLSPLRLFRDRHAVARRRARAALSGTASVPLRGLALAIADRGAAPLAAIPTDSLVGLRDRALIGTLFYTFSRVSAVAAM